MIHLKKIFSVLLLLLVIFISSCAKKTQVKILPVPVDSAMIMFKEADKEFTEKNFEKALVLYSTFINKFPENSKTPVALYNSGFIYFLGKDYPNARKNFKLLIDKYEGSSLVTEAIIKTLNSYYLEGNFDEVISYSEDIPDNLEPKSYLIRKYSITGDAFIAIKKYKEAFEAYARIFVDAKDPEKGLFLQKITEITGFLTIDDIIKLKDKSSDNSFKLLMYYNFAKKVSPKDVKDLEILAFDTLIKKNPDHPLTSELINMVKNIEMEMDCLRALVKSPKPAIKEEKIVYNPNAIGCLLPEGKFKKLGNKIEWGVQYALTKAAGTPVDISFKYIDQNPEAAVKAVREFVKEGVSSIIGPFFSPKAAVSEAQKYGIPIITLSRAENIADTGEYVFRNSLTNRMQVKTIVNHAIKKMGLKRFAVLYPNNSYGKSFSSLFWKEVTKYGGEIRGFESYKPGVTDFEKPIKRMVGMDKEIPEELIDWKKKVLEKDNKELNGDLKKVSEKKEETDDFDDDFGDEKKEEKKEEIKQKAVVDFDAIYIPDNSKTVGLILPQLNFHDVFNVQLLGNNIWHSGRLIKMARRETQKAVITEGFYSRSEQPEIKEFVKGFKEIFGVKPGFIEALAYDTAMILLGQVKNPEIKSHFELKNALLTVKDFKGVTGTTSFDVFGEASKKLILLKVKGRKFVEVK